VMEDRNPSKAVKLSSKITKARTLKVRSELCITVICWLVGYVNRLSSVWSRVDLMLMIVFMILLFCLSVVCVYVLNKESSTVNEGPESTIKTQDK